MIHHPMDLQFRRYRLIDPFQKSQKLLMALPAMPPTDHFAGSDVQGSKQGCGPVANVVLGLPVRNARLPRKDWPGAIQS